MNRPLTRVYVYTWRIALRLQTGEPGKTSIRVLPPYRSNEVKEWRAAVNEFVRMERKIWGRHLLPVYDEASGEYKD